MPAASASFSASFSALARVKLIPSDRKQFQRGALGLKLLSYFQNWNCAKQNISCFETINIFVYFCPIFVYFCWGCNCYLTFKIKITQSWIYPVLKQPRLKKTIISWKSKCALTKYFSCFSSQWTLGEVNDCGTKQGELGCKLLCQIEEAPLSSSFGDYFSKLLLTRFVYFCWLYF